jgi:leucyl-tRNA synthetase
MRSLGIDDDDEIRRFADPQYWISYFPPHVKRDLEMMGLKVNLTHSFQNRLSSYMNFIRLIGVVHLLQRMLIHFMIHLFVGNFII